MRVAKANSLLITGKFASLWLLGCLLTALFVPKTQAGDWPQILGPHRDGKADGEQLQAWAKDGPALLWSREVGDGFSGVAVAGERAILFHRPGTELVAEALDVKTGKPLWQAKFSTRFRGSISPDNGPRCVPLIHENRVYLVGPGGELAAVSLNSGETIWTRNLQQDFKAQEGYFGFGSTPVVEGDKLLMNVGGRDAGIVAFALADGKTLWTASNDDASYSSPTLATLNGQRQAVFVTRLSVASVDPRDGKVLFEFPFGQRGPTVNAATPLVLGDHLFVSSSYGVGARWVKLDASGPSVEWDSDEIMSSQYTTCIEKGGVMYGIDGRQDIGVARLRAFDPQTQKVYWTEENFGTGNLILAGDKILVLKTDGQLVLFSPTPKGYQPQAVTQLFDTTVQALPALAAGRLFARDTRTLKCLQVGKPGPVR
jgi:outer membrane protein assembly factor BamB